MMKTARPFLRGAASTCLNRYMPIGRPASTKAKMTPNSLHWISRRFVTTM